jgi:manganese oxidase
MGERGMADMGEMEMELPDNTAPMMTGTGPYGPVEMGGMFTMVKVRKDQKPGDYKDPGWYKQPPGTQAFEWTGALPEPARFQSEVKANNGFVHGLNNPSLSKPMTVNIRKPQGGHAGH